MIKRPDWLGECTMTGMREGDSKAAFKFRPSRFFKDTGNWYFHTREGSTQGPFELRSDAERGLESHLRIFKDLQLNIDNTGFFSSTRNLTLVPIQMQWR
jgi:hypothetical protein